MFQEMAAPGSISNLEAKTPSEKAGPCWSCIHGQFSFTYGLLPSDPTSCWRVHEKAWWTTVKWSLWIPSTKGTKSCSSVTWNIFHKPCSRCDPWSHSRSMIKNRKEGSVTPVITARTFFSSATPAWHSPPHTSAKEANPTNSLHFHKCTMHSSSFSKQAQQSRAFYSRTSPGNHMVIYAHSHENRLALLNQPHLSQEDHPNKSRY